MRHFQEEKDSDDGSNTSSSSLHDNLYPMGGGWQGAPAAQAVHGNRQHPAQNGSSSSRETRINQQHQPVGGRRQGNGSHLKRHPVVKADIRQSLRLCLEDGILPLSNLLASLSGPLLRKGNKEEQLRPACTQCFDCYWVKKYHAKSVILREEVYFVFHARCSRSKRLTHPFPA